MADLFSDERFCRFLSEIDASDAAKFQLSEIKDDHYDIYEFYGDVYCLVSKWEDNESISALYLIEGEEKAILIDTGMGGGDIPQLIFRLIGEKELIVVYTHEHFDHVAFAGYYENEYMMDVEESIERVNAGFTADELSISSVRTDNPYPLEGGRATATANIKPMEDGMVFELGGRSLKAIHTPGHSPASTCYYDEKYGLLFVGDIFSHGHIFIHFDDDIFMKSDLDTFIKSLDKLMPYVQKSKYIFFPHLSVVDTAQQMVVLKDAVESIRAGKVQCKVIYNDYSQSDVRCYSIHGLEILVALDSET